ncbi:Mu transposase C-terminal domain-containing protein [Pseudomonas panipatensis]|uniref:Putative transposase n=1 Tax=Pseudomonas panipatensis TaxID=428992 RepID=A0A1G8L8Q4_9PSED|nr:DDE-type integrase/transposase/recombinase [Pseudomonas panipatensis]SDI52016.1 putative transposase [Pseudomonas panipatensis]SMP75414.1 putative transposase [Pseudomonas panipatensis]
MKKIHKGQGFIWSGQECIYVASLAPGRVQIYLQQIQQYESVNLGELTPLSVNSKTKEIGDVFKVSDEAWGKALLRYDSVGKYKCGDCSIDELARELSVSVARAYALAATYDEEAGPQCMLPAARGRKHGVRMLPVQVETLIKEAIKEYKGPGVTFKSIWRAVRGQCQAAGLAVPSQVAVTSRIMEMDEAERARRRLGLKTANDTHQARPGKEKISAPLDKWEMDHCVVDCIIVDEVTRRALCRPWMTLIIDKHTRIIIGYYLSIHSPNSYSVAMAVMHAALPKDKWLRELGDRDIDYPYYGKPEVIGVDNAKEFKSRVFIRAAEKYDIKIKWRPIGKPWWGGTIERLNGTLNIGYINLLPGATLRSHLIRGDYDSEKESCMTFSEFKLWFARAVQQYNNEYHRIIKMTPHEKWVKYFTDNGVLSHPALISNPSEFSLDFMPEKERVIGRSGIEMNGFIYWAPELAPYVAPGVARNVKFNPNSIRQVWIQIPERGYLAVPFSDLSLSDMSLEEARLAKKDLKEHSPNAAETRAERSRAISKQADKNRELIKEAKISTKRARKAFENARSDRESRKSVPFVASEVDEVRESPPVDVDYTKPPEKFEIDL